MTAGGVRDSCDSTASGGVYTYLGGGVKKYQVLIPRRTRRGKRGSPTT